MSRLAITTEWKNLYTPESHLMTGMVFAALKALASLALAMDRARAAHLGEIAKRNELRAAVNRENPPGETGN
jgi:hypothetical protein